MHSVRTIVIVPTIFIVLGRLLAFVKVSWLLSRTEPGMLFYLPCWVYY